MAPKSSRNKRPTTTSTVQKNAVYEAASSAAINYGEIQSEEIDVLQAIFMDDYEEVEVKNAWSNATDRSFRLRLRSFSDDDTFIVLLVRLTATYPKTVPILEVQGLHGHHERMQTRIQNIIRSRPQALLGEVMIHAIANDIQDALEDAVQARQQGSLPSLEDERANAEEVAATLAIQAEEVEARRAEEAQQEEDRVLKQLVDEEIGRRASRKVVKPAVTDVVRNGNGARSGIVSFDQPATCQVGNERMHFNEVVIVSSLSQERGRGLFLAKAQAVDNDSTKLVVVKRILFQKSRNEILELESNLVTAIKLRHPGLLSAFAYHIERLDDTKSELIYCCDYADRGTLLDLLTISNLDGSKARQFTIELLEALEYLHRSGTAHGRLHARHIHIVSRPVLSIKLADFGYAWSIENDEKSQWLPPEAADLSFAALRKSDIWRLGEIVARMFLGSNVVRLYTSPQLMMASLEMSDSFDDLLRKFFTVEPKRRPSAFDLLTAEFLRTDDPVLEERDRPKSSALGAGSSAQRRSRHNSSIQHEPMSRYASDFAEVGRLGRGGFGEVVKARNKLDGGIYAVKKIKQTPQLLDQVLSEVMLLNRLNHPYVVRYFSTWIEEDSSGALAGSSATDTETATETATEEHTSDGPRIEFGYQSTGGLDFVSSNGFPQIEFGEDSDSESSDVELDKAQSVEHDASASDFEKAREADQIQLRRSKSESKRPPSTLYIQMEYCERHTLRDLIHKSMNTDDSWRYARQITEGLAHIHGHGILHRDLKPDNVFIDLAGNPKIGDFGLATTTQQYTVDRAATMSGYSAGELTRSVGTTLYVAPELRSVSGTSYNDKVDMYSLGIMFFEMCEPFSTGMERIKALQKIREKGHELPPTYQSYGVKAAQGKLITRLISHKPSERPSSAELLRSDMLPVKIEDEVIRKALSSLSDARSPYHQKMMSALFAPDSSSESRVKALAWDARSSTSAEDDKRLRFKHVARQTLEKVFRRHGAEQRQRQTIFPRSGHYTTANVVQLLDGSGNLLQLPFDLVLPHARQLAREHSEPRCTFSFGNAYREAFDGGPPRASEEVDFDITNNESDNEYAFNDAEAIKVMDEVICEMPLFATSTTTGFHLNHSSILDAILGFCRIALAQQAAVKEIISRLGFHQHTWSKIRAELRRFGLPDTTLDDLQQFDFRDVPEKSFSRLKALVSTANNQWRPKLDAGIDALTRIIRFLSVLNVQKKLYVTPLGSVNAKFYEDGLLFQCVAERRSNRAVIAAGGRYDGLIKSHRPPEARTKAQGCVGVSIGLDPIVTNMMRSSDTARRKTHSREQPGSDVLSRRCDVLINASGTEDIGLAGIRLLAMLWENGVNAELASSRTARNNNSNKDHHFIVALKHEASGTVKVIHTASEAEETDVAIPALVSYLQQELRERESNKARQPSLLRHASQPDNERRSNVHVLLARHGSKKSNKYQIVNDAQEQWSRKLEEAKNAPILAVETRDEVLDLIRETRLSDAESWRRAVQNVQLHDRQYVQQIQDVLSSWRKTWEEGAGMREACVYNFRTQRSMYYDLGL